MSELERYIRDAIRKKIGSTDIEVVDVVALSTPASLQDALNLFDQGNEHDVHYVVKIRKPTPEIQGFHEIHDSEPRLSQYSGKPSRGGVYDPQGKVNVEFLLKNGKILLSAGDYALAKNIFTALRKSGEASADACMGLAQCHEGLGDFDAAKAAYEEAIAFKPSYEGLDRLAKLLIGKQHFQYAAEVMDRALKIPAITPEQTFDLYLSTGNCLVRLERNEEAEKQYKQALEVNPSADEIQSNLGALYIQAGKISYAKKAFRDALASNPGSTSAHLGLGCCLLIEKEKTAAHDHFVKCLEGDIHNPRALFYLIKTAFDIHHYGPAEKITREYIQSGPLNPSLLYALSAMQLHLGKTEESKQTARKILSLRPDHKGAKELAG